jgi:hypothetical protein
MSQVLLSIQDYVTDVRTIILDKVQPYRYPDDSLVEALNIALLEGRRLRSDLFVCRYGNDVPRFTSVSGEEVPIEPQFRLAFVYGIAAHVLLRDEEDVQDSRSNTFLERFHDMLVGVRPSPIAGGTPGGAPAQKGAGIPSQ